MQVKVKRALYVLSFQGVEASVLHVLYSLYSTVAKAAHAPEQNIWRTANGRRSSQAVAIRAAEHDPNTRPLRGPARFWLCLLIHKRRWDGFSLDLSAFVRLGGHQR